MSISSMATEIALGLRMIGIPCELPDLDPRSGTCAFGVRKRFADGWFCVDLQEGLPIAIIKLRRAPGAFLDVDEGGVGGSVDTADQAIEVFRQLDAGARLGEVSVFEPDADDADWWKGGQKPD